ncbi:hypothetical protein SEVIR_5G331750v4 [Setaria viridis]
MVPDSEKIASSEAAPSFQTPLLRRPNEARCGRGRGIQEAPQTAGSKVAPRGGGRNSSAGELGAVPWPQLRPDGSARPRLHPGGGREQRRQERERWVEGGDQIFYSVEPAPMHGSPVLCFVSIEPTSQRMEPGPVGIGLG